MELMIVIVILGILATIVIPQTSNAAAESREKSTHSQVQSLRRQIELYRLEHNALPNLAASWDAMCQSSTVDGETFGPYLASPPSNPMNGLGSVADGTGATPPAAACGYIYDYNGGTGTGMLYATGAGGTILFTE